MKIKVHEIKDHPQSPEHKIIRFEAQVMHKLAFEKDKDTDEIADLIRDYLKQFEITFIRRDLMRDIDKALKKVKK